MLVFSLVLFFIHYLTNIMKTSEQFAISEWLTEWPENATYDQILDMVRNDDLRITVWQVAENMGRYNLADTIDDLRIHFEYTVANM